MKMLKLLKLDLGQKLTLRYILALIIIGSVVLMAYLVLLQKIDVNQKDAYIINISGMQTMLSQRIALFASEIYHAQSEQQADAYAQDMQAALNLMLSNHQQLTTGRFRDGELQPLSPAVQEMFFREGGVDDRVQVYTAAAADFLQLYENKGLSGVQNSTLMFDIVTIAREGLLEQLNEIVFQYQAEAEDHTKSFKTLETMFLLMTFLTLGLEVIFIFRPMVQNITRITHSLEAKNAEMLEFSYRISHDLKSPIVSSIGLLEKTQKALKAKKYDEVSEALKYFKTVLSRFEEFVQSVINVAKVGMQEQEPEPVLIQNVIEEAIDRVSYLPHYEKIRIQRNIEFHEHIYIHKAALRQILENLISNAIKYYDPEKEFPHVSISLKQKQGQVQITVEDNGTGIPEKHHADVFKMFQKFHTNQAFGSGLGLYLVLKNAQHIGAHVKYRALQDGSAFDVIIEHPILAGLETASS